jgi:hypothetical protein
MRQFSVASAMMRRRLAISVYYESTPVCAFSSRPREVDVIPPRPLKDRPASVVAEIVEVASAASASAGAAALAVPQPNRL